MLFNNSQVLGITTELLVAQKFIEYGYIVSIPYGNNSRYDMIVDTDIHRYRIQIKHATKNDNGSYTVQTCNSITTATKHERKYYNKQDVDFLVSIIENQLVVIPVEMIEHSATKVFRVILPEFGSKSKCNLIQDYTVERFIME